MSGLQKGWSGFFWICKIIVPISFLTFLLEYSGWISRIDFLLKPGLNMLSLPSIAALPLIAGMLSGIYGGIASMAVLPLTQTQMTLITVFLLISHNLIQEGIVQGKSGLHPLKSSVVRLAASIVAVMVVAQLLDADSAVNVKGIATDTVKYPFAIMLKGWALKTLYLCAKILVIIVVLMMILETMKCLDIIDRIVNVLSPLLKILGLNKKVGILWLTAALFGIAYGAAVIVAEAKGGNLTSEDLTKLHLSIGINHSMIDDPALFLSVGIHPFWLWVPRLILAIIVVWLYTFVRRLDVYPCLAKFALRQKK